MYIMERETENLEEEEELGDYEAVLSLGTHMLKLPTSVQIAWYK